MADVWANKSSIGGMLIISFTPFRSKILSSIPTAERKGFFKERNKIFWTIYYIASYKCVVSLKKKIYVVVLFYIEYR